MGAAIAYAVPRWHGWRPLNMTTPHRNTRAAGKCRELISAILLRASLQLRSISGFAYNKSKVSAVEIKFSQLSRPCANTRSVFALSGLRELAVAGVIVGGGCVRLSLLIRHERRETVPAGHQPCRLLATGALRD